VDVTIQSAKSFEKDLSKLSKQERELVIEKVNYCAQVFPLNKAAVYRKMQRPHTLHLIHSYESSLYTLKVSLKVRVILAVDEDPIFEQVIFTLFRVIQADELDQAYGSIAEPLYQQLLAQERQTAQML